MDASPAVRVASTVPEVPVAPEAPVVPVVLEVLEAPVVPVAPGPARDQKSKVHQAEAKSSCYKYYETVLSSATDNTQRT